MNRYVEYLLNTYVYYNDKNISYEGTENRKKSILLICRHPLGDTVVESPFIRAIRKQYPKHYIMMICAPENYNLVERCPYVDEIIPYSGKVEGSFYKTHLKQIRQFAKDHYADKNFDLAIISSTCMPSLIEGWLVYLTHAKRRVTFTEKLNAGMHHEYMGAYDRFFTDVLDSLGEVHEVENNNAMLEHLGIEVTDDSYELWTDEKDAQAVEELWQEKQIDDGKIKIIVNLSTSSKSKDWPVERYIDVCRAVREKHDVEYILIGAGKSAREYGDTFLKQIQAHDFINATTIRQTAEIMKRADMYLGGDTGPLHMAAAMKLSGVAVYKSATNTDITYNYVKRLYPWHADIKSLYPETALPGCEETGCAKDEAHCIKKVSAESVYLAMQAQFCKLDCKHK